MSNKSGVAEQIISLPKGGGALKGLGEKFKPDLHTGTGNLSVPIAITPGRNGFQPQITMAYSTGSGNGPFGLGWSLSVPSVSRKTTKGIPRYQDKDTFILSGAEDLVLVREEKDAGNTRRLYRPRTEDLFARIIHITGDGCNYWEVRTKDGLKSIYGKTPASQVYDHNPDQSGCIYQWLLSETQDPFGNRIVYKYKPEDRAGLEQRRYEEGHNYNQVYLSKIEYVNYLPENTSCEEFLFSIEFDYGEYPDGDSDLAANPLPVKPWAYRPDPFSVYRPGFEIRTVRRCRRILIKVRDEDSMTAGQLVKAYHLRYLDELSTTERRGETLPLNGASLLAEIILTGYRRGGEKESMPPLIYHYTRFEPEKRKYETFNAEGGYLPERALNSSEYELVDLHGCGLPDIIHTSPAGFRYWRNMGNCRFDFPRPMPQAPAGITLNDPGVQFADMEGNGTADLLVTNGSLSGYFPNRFGARWDPLSFRKYQQAPSFDLRDPDVKLVDMDGDGVIDALHTGSSHFVIYYNRGRQGWDSQVQRIPRRCLDQFPDIYFSAPDQRVRLAAMSGDGLQDIVLIHDRLIQYWPYLGYGRWGSRITMRNAPQLPYNYDPRRLFLADIDGDGYADLIYVDFGRVLYWINQNGNAWSGEHIIEGTPPVSDVDAIRVVDMKGTGTAGILWTYDYSVGNRTNYKYLDLTGGVKPYLLDGMDNNLGAVTRVNYAPSTKFAIIDKERGIPWLTHLPFPVQVVERVEVIDAVSKGKLVTRYEYHHGCWDGVEREFRGFGMVEQFDTETFENYHNPVLHGNGEALRQQQFSPPALTRTWFHLGAVGDEFGEWCETDFSREFWPGDPQMISRPQPVKDFLDSLPRRVKRDAVRVLRGSILRTELFALDNTERRNRPYTVTEYLYGVREEDPPGQNDKDRQRIFFPHVMGKRTTQWERGDDPMTQFSFTEDYDQYGQPRRQTLIACPRGWRKPGDIPGQPYLTTCSLTVYAKSLDPQIHIMDRVAKTTTYEIKNDGSQRIFELKAWPDESSTFQIIGQTLNFYDGDISQADNGAFLGLPFGQIGKYGALVRSENLVFTDDILQKAYETDLPPYLAHSGSVAWTKNYPKEFRTVLPALAGYTYQPGGAGSEFATGYFAATELRRYDFHEDPSTSWGLVKTQRDPLGHDTWITYEVPYSLLPMEVTDPVGLTAGARYDYRVLQPVEVTDPNGNKTCFTYTPLGLLETSSIKGKNGQGDRQRPSVAMKYDFLAFIRDGLPINIRTIRQVHHDTELDILLTERDEMIETREYSDGFGRLLQTRTQGEEVRFGNAVFGGGDEVLPANQNVRTNTGKDVVGRRNIDPANPNVVVSGWQVYDNKGRVVEKYEPFFSTGWDYAAPEDNHYGQKSALYNDPLGRVIRTVNPDTSEQLVVYGIPLNLADPARYAPSPWEAYTYDANDNAGRTPAADPNAAEYGHHWNTPASAVVDALGRTIAAIERNRANTKPGGPVKSIEEYTIRSTYDIQGNPLTVIDALGRVAFKHEYDLAKRPLRIESMDAGTRITIWDALGNTVEQRDSKGAILLRTHDVLNRPLRLWARDDADSPLTLRQRLEYGDGSDPNQPVGERDTHRAANRLSRLYKHYDEAGLLTIDEYDFKGNILEKVRKVVKDDPILSAFNNAASDRHIRVYRVNWEPKSGLSFDDHVSVLLDPRSYNISTAYDALNRIKSLHYPDDVGDSQNQPPRKVLCPKYNRAGALESVRLNNQNYVEHIAYNAKGQRTFIAFGNKVMTRYAYHPQTFRLMRMRTECYGSPLSVRLTYHPTGAPLQDFAYRYDLAGNILSICDRTPECGIRKTDSLDRQFKYDAVYRLISATGREEDRATPQKPWEDRARSTDPTMTRGYTQSYTYDPTGNMVELKHDAGPANSFNRIFTLMEGSNRLASVKIGFNLYTCIYDPNGNMIGENTERHFCWDYSDRLTAFYCQPRGSDIASLKAQYLYDAGGQRVKKLVQKQGREYEVTVYIDGVFEYHRLVKGRATSENNTLHIMDNQSRIAMVRVGAAFPDDGAPEIAVRYHLGDHLGSSNVVVGGRDGSANDLINREEYYPYSETSFGSFARKRYRFTGKERDEESGLYYHGARYYAPWLAKWVSCDPLGMVDGPNLYIYARCNPCCLIDENGTEAGESGDWSNDYNNLSHEQRVKYNIEQQRGRQIELNQGKSVGNKTEAVLLHAGALSPVGPPPQLPKYYSLLDQALDQPDPMLSWLPGFKAGWLLMEAWHGETLSGQSVNRNMKLLDAVLTLAMDYGEVQLLAGAASFAGGLTRRATSLALSPAYNALDAVAATATRQGHVLRVRIYDKRWNLTNEWFVVSQKGLPGKLGHTEQLALGQMKLKPGQTAVFEGIHPPCPYTGGCHKAMSAAAKETGGDILYWYPDPRTGTPVNRFYSGGEGAVGKGQLNYLLD